MPIRSKTVRAAAGYSGTPLPKKLGIDAARRVLLVNAPPEYRSSLPGLRTDVKFVRAASDSTDFVQAFYTKESDMAKALAKWRGTLPSSATIWISWPKKSSGVDTDITEDTVRKVALPLGLVDVKVCAVDEVWSGLKLVVRKELRMK